MAVSISTNAKATPNILAKVLLKAIDKDKQALVDIHELLTRLFIRNRNQHRRSLWFKSLTQFRKELGLLIEEFTSSKKASLSEKIEQRLKYWDEKCVHQWYLYVFPSISQSGFTLMLFEGRSHSSLQ